MFHRNPQAQSGIANGQRELFTQSAQCIPQSLPTSHGLQMYDSTGIFCQSIRSVQICEFTVCHNISRVDVVKEVSVEDFTARYAYTYVPLLVRAATKDWAATDVLSYEFFKDVYLNRFPGSLDVLEEHCQFFPYRKEFRRRRNA